MSDTPSDQAGSSSSDAQRPPPSHPPVEVERPPTNPKTSAAVMVAFVLLAVAAVVLGGKLLNPKASTTDGDYAGETIELWIPLAEGGGTDTWARFIGTELSQEIPGKPGFSPVNEAGGEGISGTNRFAASAPADGTEILVSTASTVMPWVLGRSEVEYSFSRLTPILANGTGGVIYARTEAGVRRPEDLLDREAPLKFGGISATGLDLTTLVAFDLLGVHVDATFGFEGRGPVNLALQRGEIDLDYQTTSAYGPAVEPLVKAGTAVPLMSFGQVDDRGDVVRDPNFPNIPTVAEVYDTLHGKAPSGASYEAYKKLLALTYTYQKAMWVPDDTPQQAVELLRASAERLSLSPDFNQKAAKVLGGYPLLADQRLTARIDTAYTVDAPVRQYIVKLLESDYQVQLD